jgi:hypothetical protein
MKQGQFPLKSSLPLKILAAAGLAALLYGFSPLRSDQAAHEAAPLLAAAPAPQSPGADSSAPLGAGAIAVGVATLAASRRK